MFESVSQTNGTTIPSFLPRQHETTATPQDIPIQPSPLYRKLSADLSDHLQEAALVDGGLDAESLAALGAWLETCSPRDPRRHILELCLFAGFSAEEAAEALDVSLTTVRRELCLVRLYAARCLEGSAVAK
ncbi:MAG: ECF-type sigma factor [Acidobacteriota bacterium]|nr:ECF-type sigma factor [Acidobacteriota bacterium]